MEHLSFIKGALLGGWCGDAAGAVLEFYQGTVTEEIIEQALHMCGGGCFQVGPGQVTDDSELEMAMINGLIEYNQQAKSDGSLANKYPKEIIALHYIKWYHSQPFDIGGTTTRAFRNALNVEDVSTNVQKYNLQSIANGGLMRSVPIAIWSKDEPIETILSFAQADASLSHGSEICKEVNGLYILGIAMLLKHSHLPIHTKASLALSTIASNIQLPEVHTWYDTAVTMTSLSTMNCQKNIGWVKHAFMLTIYFLSHLPEDEECISYEEIIRAVLWKGGDTDTNAKIVGAMIGALVGEEQLPSHMTQPVLHFDCTNWDMSKNAIGHQRPEEYHIRRAYERIEILIKPPLQAV